MRGDSDGAGLDEPARPHEAVDALEAGLVDGIVVDLPTAFRLARDVEDAEIVGQFPATDPLVYDALAAEEGSPLLECLDLVVEHLGFRTDWLATEQSWWLSERAKTRLLQ
ncbi:MAG TPA: hypothetical protein VK915_07905 [Gaiellaceae bacterium]|nr:hypothetical protein [Gaiellaceae bacterium]